MFVLENVEQIGGNAGSRFGKTYSVLVNSIPFAIYRKLSLLLRGL